MPDAVPGKLILVRHGQTEANRDGIFAASEDIPLTETGRRQAAELAEEIERQFQPKTIVSSEFRRARQTADIIACRLGLINEILPGLHEREFGALRGQPYAAMGAMMRNDPLYDSERHWLWSPGNGESLDAVQLRVIGALTRIQTAYSSHDVVVVSHGAVMECVAAHLAQDWRNARVPPNCGMLVVATPLKKR